MPLCEQNHTNITRFCRNIIGTYFVQVFSGRRYNWKSRMGFRTLHTLKDHGKEPLLSSCNQESASRCRGTIYTNSIITRHNYPCTLYRSCGVTNPTQSHRRRLFSDSPWPLLRLAAPHALLHRGADHLQQGLVPMTWQSHTARDIWSDQAAGLQGS